MTTTELHRPARTFPASVDAGVVDVAAPPQAPSDPEGGLLAVLLPVLGSMGIFGFVLISGDRRYLIMAGFLAGAMLLSGVVSRRLQRKNARRNHLSQVDRYRQHLRVVEDRLDTSVAAQRRWSAIQYPPVEDLWSVAIDRRRLWERRPHHEDFLDLRLGIGQVAPLLRPRIDLETSPLTEYDADMVEAARTVVESNRAIPGEPVVLPLGEVGCVGIVGDKGSDALLRALVAQLAVFRGPDDLRLIVWHESDRSPDWSWAHALPHLRWGSGADQPAVTDSVDDLRLIVDGIVGPRRDLLESASEQIGTRRRIRFTQTILILDGYRPAAPIGGLDTLHDLMATAAELGFTVLCRTETELDVPEHAGATITVGPNRLAEVSPSSADGPRHEGVTAEAASLDQVANLARVLATLRPRTVTGQTSTVESAGLFDLLGVSSIDEISADLWSGEEGMRAPIGVAEDGSPMFLDLRESSAGGQGPHGILIGATGSGKSELLRTLVLGLAARHAPEDLAMVLVDFKGGATFAKLDRLPHAAGTITNLERDPGLIDRMQEALYGELERRQRLLHAAGLDRADEYRAHRRAHPERNLEPMPALLVVVDEFGELLANRPEFGELFLAIGRTGRSLGVHLLLSSQRLEDGRIRKLEGHLRYRLCLRTFTAEESRSVIGTAAAAELPPIPGVGFVGVDGQLQSFKAGLANRPVRGVREADGTTATEMSIVVERLGEAVSDERRTRPIWLEPLPTTVAVGDLTETDATVTWLEPAIGLCDEPRDQRVSPHRLDFAGSGGHLAVVGAPRTGKSTFLQTLVTALAADHDPVDVQIYAVDLGGGALHGYEALPHVGAVLGRSHRQEVPRLVRQLRGLVEHRSEQFRLHGITDMVGFHRARRAGDLQSDLGEVFLIVDNWAVFEREFGTDVVEEVGELVAGGLHYGVHVVIAASRWNDIRMAMRDNIGGRFELHLNDPIDSEIDRRRAQTIPSDTPGRGLALGGRQVQVAIPSLLRNGTLAGPEHVATPIAERWQGAPHAPGVRLLPERVSLDEIVANAEGDGVVLGVEETRLGPWTVDLFGADPHFLVLGDAESGKTTLLRTWIRQLVESRTPSELQIALVDRRRQLLSEVPEAYRMAAGTTPESISRLATTVSAALAARQVPEDMPVIGHDGPAIVVVADDYDQVAGAAGNPLTALTEWTIQGRDVGFHLVLTRRVGGATRASFEPLYQRVREMGTPGLILSGDPMEGPVLSGFKASPQAPGRGVAVSKGRATEVQVAETVPSADVRTMRREQTA